MEPHQEQQQQHYPSPARHHGCNPISSSSSISDKRFIRRSVQGTPYPQAIAIPPPPLSSSPPRLGLSTSNLSSPGSGGNSIFSPRTPNGRTLCNHIGPIPPLSSQAGSPSPQLAPRTPTSSLARRRRLSIISTGSSSPSNSINSNSHGNGNHNTINSNNITPPIPLFSPTLESPPSLPQLTMSQRHTFDSVVGGQSGTKSPGAFGSNGNNNNFNGNRNDNNLNGFNFGKKRIISPPTPGGGGPRDIPRDSEENSHNFDDDDDDTYDLAQELQEAMDEDEREEMMMEGMGNGNGNGNGGESGWEGHGGTSNGSNTSKKQQADESLAKIAQAMTLLSLKPPTDPLQPHFPSFFTSPPGGTADVDPEPPWPPHPTPESLLRESLRQSLEALRILKVLDGAVVMGSGARDRQPSRRQSVKMGDVSCSSSGGSGSGNRDRDYSDDGSSNGNGDISVVDVMKAYDKAAEGVRAAREVLSWAEHWIGEERDRTRDRLLKG